MPINLFKVTKSVDAAALEPFSFKMRELEDCRKRILEIQSELDIEAVHAKPNLLYPECRDAMYATILTTKQAIRKRYMLMENSGNTYATISLGYEIKQKINSMKGEYIELTQLSLKYRSNLSAKQTMETEKELKIIHAQIEECEDLSADSASHQKEELLSLTDFVKTMENANLSAPNTFQSSGGKWREPTAKELEVISSWRQQDAKIDKSILALGDDLDELADLTLNIEDRTREQARLAVNLSRQLDEVSNEITQVNTKLQEVAKKMGGFNFFTKLLLALIFAVLLSTTVKNIASRIKGSGGGQRSNSRGFGGSVLTHGNSHDNYRFSPPIIHAPRLTETPGLYFARGTEGLYQLLS